MKDQSLRVLIVEDSEDDALLIIRELKKGGYNPVHERVETAAAMKKALKEKQWDIILCDYVLPKFNAPSAIALLKEATIDIPIIIVSGTIGEETAIECMHLGAQDYIMKGNLPRLCPAIARELEESTVRSRKKQAESQRETVLETLRQSEEKYRTILENIEDGYYEVDLKGNFTFFNNSMCRILGYHQKEMMGMNYRQITDKENVKKVFQSFNKVYNTGESTKEFDWQTIRKGGTKRYIEQSVALKKDSSGKRTGFRGIVRDITERKRAESQREAALDALRESEYKYKSLIENISDIIFTIDLEGRITFISKRTTEIIGYENEEMIKMNIFNFIAEEDHQRTMKNLQKGMKGERIKHIQMPVIAKSGEKLFFEFSFSRIYKNGAVVGAQGTAVDINERKRADEKFRQSLENLRKSFGVTIQVLVTAVEMRDPYTAGHQVRSADIARAIAIEMGLDQEKIEGIRLAGSIHDIGKLSIPAEILSKPSKLTNIEFSLIKGHSQSGYEMLKNVESPWPLADIVYQHHERMDGSGYPRNLKGDEIILEARIMAVADVVEAMASHRPYRSALGIEIALEEIEKNKGILYDNDVADACLRLFRKKGYSLLLKKS